MDRKGSNLLHGMAAFWGPLVFSVESPEMQESFVHRFFVSFDGVRQNWAVWLKLSGGELYRCFRFFTGSHSF